MKNIEYKCPMGYEICHCYETSGFEHKQEMIDIIYKNIADVVDNDCGIDGSLEPRSIQLPIRIGDVLDWIDKKLPIEAQTDECIKYIYNLIKNERQRINRVN